MKILFILFFLLFYPATNFSQEIREYDSLTTASFSAVGDLIVHGQQLKYAKIDSLTYEFKPVFREIKQYLQSADFTMANLETVFAGIEKGYSGYPSFNTPDSFLDALKYAGIDFLFTANNHALDFNRSGLERTINLLNSSKVGFSGTFLHKEEKDSIKIIEVNGITFTILSYSYLANKNIDKGYEYMLNTIKLGQIRRNILKAKSMNLDLVIVYLHFGNEYENEPSNYQIETVKSIKSYGADIILASHTHSIQPVEMYKPVNSKLDSGFVAYSLGNFISNQRWRYSDAGVILNFTIEKKIINDSLYISDFSFIPTWVYKGNTGNGKEFLILPAEYSQNELNPPYIKSKDLELMKQSFNDTKKIITQKTGRLKLKSILKE